MALKLTHELNPNLLTIAINAQQRVSAAMRRAEDGDSPLNPAAP